MCVYYYDFGDSNYRFWKSSFFNAHSPALPAYRALRMWLWDPETNKLTTIKSQPGDLAVDEQQFFLIQLAATKLPQRSLKLKWA